MDKNYCFVPQQGIDDVIADKIKELTGSKSNIWSQERVALLRGMYTEYSTTPLDVNNIEEAAKKLLEYKNKLEKDITKIINDAFSKTDKKEKTFSYLYQQLNDEFTHIELTHRVSAITNMFSKAVDAIQRRYPQLSREEICNGTTIDGIKVGGQGYIFNIVYNQLFNYYANAVEDGYENEIEGFKKMIDNFAALTSFARFKLRDTEGIKLGDRVDFAVDTNEEDYSEIESNFDPEESTREAYQEENDKKSSFGLIGKDVRRAISYCTMHDENGRVYDDLGFPVTLDPISTHQRLADLLRGITSEEQMMQVLRSELSNSPEFTEIVVRLEKDNLLRTQFFVDFHKGFQLYSILKAKFKNGIKSFITKIINTTNEDDFNAYVSGFMTGSASNSDTIFDENGNIKWGNLQLFRDKVKEYFETEGVLDTPKFYKRGELTQNQRIDIIRDLFNMLGYQIDDSSLKSLMSYNNTKKLNRVIKSLKDIVKFGIEGVLSNEQLKALSDGTAITEVMSFNKLFRSKTKNSSKNGLIYDNIQKITKELSKTAKSYERRARWKDSKGNSVSYDSYVNPCFMSEMFDAIHSYVENKDTNGLRTYLKNKYLNSSMFYDKEKHRKEGYEEGTINPDFILNQWIKDLYLSDLTKEDSFAETFTFERFLGGFENNTDFENFTSKKHMIALFQMYNSDKEQNRGNYAHYPTFILGDSNVAKFITAKRYSQDEILDGLYKVFLQERQRMKLENDFLDLCEEHNIKSLQNVTRESANSYSCLGFLNDEHYKSRIDPDHYESSVKSLIREYMESYKEDFKKKLKSLGVLDVYEKREGLSKVKVYPNLGNIREDKLDEYIEDYCWNNKYALINQLQLFTIDTSFYMNVKDLQKRYKEIHAPGIVLSTSAIDYDGNKYSEDGIEKCIYFDDIKLPAPDDFTNSIKSILGEDIASIYTKNSLTDGQGYRTLDSYRKVLGMAGKWTREMDNAYKTIKSIRDKYNSREESISEDDLKTITELSLVFQPIKPYMFTHERVKIGNDELIIPVQHKYAEIVLIPEIMPDCALRDMAYYMEDNNIDMACATSAVKVGAYGSVDIKSAKSKDELIKVLGKAIVHNLNYSDYRIQTNVPLHLYSDQLFGTQIRKLIMAGVDMKGTGFKYDSYVDGNSVNLGGNTGRVRLNGKNLVAFYNSLIISNILESYDKFENSVSDINKLSDLLSQNIISNSRESLDNLLAYSVNEDGEFTIPLYEGGLEHDSAAALLSIFKKIVNKQKIKGGSAVQASAYGLKGYEESGDLQFVADPDNPSNILYAECELTFNLSYTDAYGNTVALKFEDWCNPDGTLKLGKELSSNDPEYKKYLSYRDENNKVHKPLIEETFPDILSIIAYRIPTENDYSMINLKIKRFTPLIGGGVIKLPLQSTTIAGFDFDIDKLFFMMREFSELKPYYQRLKLSSDEFSKIIEYIKNKYPSFVTEHPSIYNETFSDAQLFDIFSDIYEQNDDIYTDLRQIRENSGDYREYKDKKGNLKRAYTHSLNYYFDQSSVAKEKAEKLGFADIIDYKQYLVAKSAMELGLTPEVLELRQEGYTTLDKEAIQAAGVKISSLFEEAGEALNIKIKENVNEKRFDTYDYSKPPMTIVNEDGTIEKGNTRVARNNMLIELIQQRLMDEETFRNRYTPGGFKGASKAARIMRELLFGKTDNYIVNGEVSFNKLYEQASKEDEDPEPNYDPTDVMTIITYNQQNQVAGKLIGIFANQNTNNAFSSLMQKFELKYPIEFCGHSYKDLLNSPDGVDTDLNVAEFLAASVDAVKDPVLNFLNLNNVTADAGAILARLGYTTEEIGLLFNQPIIKEICEYSNNNNVSVSLAIQQIVNKYRGYVSDDIKIDNSSITKEILADNIVQGRLYREQEESSNEEVEPSSDFVDSQIKVANLFSDILACTRDISNFVNTSKFTASNAIGSTFGDMYAQKARVEEYIKSSETDRLSFVVEVNDYIHTTISQTPALHELSNSQYLDSMIYNPFGYEQTMYDMIQKVLELFGKYFPYNNPAFVLARNSIQEVINANLDSDIINSIHRDFPVYLLSQKPQSLFKDNTPITVDGIDTTTREYYINIFPKKLANFLKNNPTIKSKYSILKFIKIVFDEETDKTYINITNMGGLQSYQREDIKNSWLALFKDYPYIAGDLFMYNFHTSGFNFTPFSFMNYTPTELKQRLKVSPNETYIDFYKSLKDSSYSFNINDFVKQYILNHLDNYKLTFTPKGDNYKYISKLAYTNGTINDSFELDLSGDLDKQKVWINKVEYQKDGPTIISVKPCIIIDNYVFLAENNDNGLRFNSTTSKSITYRRYAPLGKTNVSTHYASFISDLSSNVSKDSLLDIEKEETLQNPDIEDGGSTEIKLLDEIPSPITQTRDEVIEVLSTEFYKAFAKRGVRDDMGEVIPKSQFVRMFSDKQDDELNALIDQIRRACRKNGILVLDENYELMENC